MYLSQASNWAPSQLLTPSPVGWERELDGQKHVEQLMCGCWEKDSLSGGQDRVGISRRNNKTQSDTRAITHHLPPADWCPASCFGFLSPYYYWAWHAQNTNLVKKRHMSQLCLLPDSCSPRLLSGAKAEWETEQAIMVCKHCSAIAETLAHYQQCSGEKNKIAPWK